MPSDSSSPSKAPSSSSATSRQLSRRLFARRAMAGGAAAVLPVLPDGTAQAATGTWGPTGNPGTDVATNFLGTTDNHPLAIRTNNREVIRVRPPVWSASTTRPRRGCCTPSAPTARCSSVSTTARATTPRSTASPARPRPPRPASPASCGRSTRCLVRPVCAARRPATATVSSARASEGSSGHRPLSAATGSWRRPRPPIRRRLRSVPSRAGPPLALVSSSPRTCSTSTPVSPRRAATAVSP